MSHQDGAGNNKPHISLTEHVHLAAMELRDAQPLLTLDSDGPSRGRFRSLAPGHSLYPMASWAVYHADSLADDQRRGFFKALSKLWPRTQGRSRNEHQRFWFGWLTNAGVEPHEIAKVWRMSEASVRDVIRDLRRELEGSPDVETFHISCEARPERPALLSPFDPGTQYGSDVHDTHPVTQDDLLADEIASARGFPSATAWMMDRFPNSWGAESPI